MGKVRFDFITLLKCVAILMITNSHFKPVYPASLQALSFGGAWGCAMFFFCSGFTMANTDTGNFLKYALKRVIRIYPAVWVFYLVTLQYLNALDWYYYLIPKFWFLRAILLFYFVFYFVIKYLRKYIPAIIGLLCAAVIGIYVFTDHSGWMIDLTYNPQRITWFYYFAIMLFGAWLRNSGLPACDGARLTSIVKVCRWAAIPASILACYAIKFACTKNLVPMNVQLLFPVMLFASAYMVWYFLRDMKANPSSVEWKSVAFIASITLELYIVQQYLINLCSPLPKAYAVITAIAVIFVAAYLLHIINNFIAKKVLPALHVAI